MKRVAMGLAFAMAVSAFASQHPQTINRAGFVGVNKTQSGQSLGHSKLVFKSLGEITFGDDMFPSSEGQPALNYNGQQSEVADYTGLSAYVGFSIGILNYIDLGFTLPVFYDQFSSSTISNTKTGYIGNLGFDAKFRAPLPEDQPLDVALFGGLTIHTASDEKQGVWVREPEYINKNNGVAYPFGASNMVAKVGLAITADLSKVDAAPLLFHLNGGYRYSTNKDYESFAFASAALELYAMDFLSLFVEGYYDIQLNKFKYWMPDPYDPTVYEEKLDMLQLTGALVFHLPIGLDIQLGASAYMSGDNHEIHSVSVLEDKDRPLGVKTYKTRVNPALSIFGGLTWSGFLLPQDRDNDGVVDTEDNCPDDYGHRLNQGCPLGNPDTDEDGVCDAWVSEKGLMGEFTNICSGVDQCPNEKGDSETGCALGDPDADKDGICDPWVSQQKLSEKFADICKGIDNCPAEPGTEAAKGCPEDNPDPDGDGMCSPWVTDKNKLAQYAGVCKGYDMCPGEAGAAGNKGCPWDDPDSDGDGMCDEWVVQKKMGFYFEKAAEDTSIAREWFIEKTCKGLDKCPLEHGPAANDGCPLGDPDIDKDGLCDPWVAEKSMQDQFDGICTGIDKCPSEAGEAWAQGCPMDDPDPDKDGVCSEWVATKKLQKDFESICTGIDRCPDVAGDDGHGCPKKAVENLEGVTFKSGKATLESNAKKILKGVAKKLVSDEAYKDLNIVIQGHTDNKGKAKKNLKLSENRAKAVMKMLTKYGVKKDRIKAIGLGSTCPVDDNSTADGREMNRRIEMHFVTPDNDGMKCESNYVAE